MSPSHPSSPIHRGQRMHRDHSTVPLRHREHP